MSYFFLHLCIHQSGTSEIEAAAFFYFDFLPCVIVGHVMPVIATARMLLLLLFYLRRLFPPLGHTVYKNTPIIVHLARTVRSPMPINLLDTLIQLQWQCISGSHSSSNIPYTIFLCAYFHFEFRFL